MLDAILPADLSAEVSIDFTGDSSARDAGILFRCSGASVGYDAQRGYFAGLIPRTGLMILGKMDGENWTELARAKTGIDVAQPQQISVRVTGPTIKVFHNGSERIEIQDSTYPIGTVGLRVVDTQARFSGLKISEVTD